MKVKFLSIFTMLLSFSFLSGCADPYRVNYQYQDKSQPDSEIAKIRHNPDKVQQWAPFIEQYKKEGDEEWTNISSFWVGHTTALNLEPGRYWIMFYCASRGRYAFPAVDVEVKAGETYLARCFNGADGTVGAELTPKPSKSS